MATSGRSDGEINCTEGVLNWPLEYVRETKEYKCGQCGQALTANLSHHHLETHFQTCEKSNETALLMGFKNLLKVNRKIEGLNADVQTRVDKMKAELMEEIQTELQNIKADVGAESDFNMTQLDKKFLNLKADLKKDLERDMTSAETSDGTGSTLLNRVNVLEEKMREMSADQEKKIAEVNGRVSEVTETVSTVINSMMEVKGKEGTSSTDNVLSNQFDRSKKETEAIWVQLRKSEGDIQLIKMQLEDERAKVLAKKKSFHVEPSAFHQLAIPMNCFNLVTHNYLFQPSYKWTIDGIKAKLSRGTFQLTSQMFQWNGYDVRVRAKLQLKENGYVYVWLRLKTEGKVKDFRPIPQVFYMLKDKNSRSPNHRCRAQFYLWGTAFKYSISYDTCFCPKSCLNLSKYRANDAVEIEIYVEPSPMTQQVHSYDGTLEWKMEHYARRLQAEKNHLVPGQESPYFYTGPNGYRIRVELCLNGYEGKGLTARVMFLTGKGDGELPESFLYSIAVTLINPKNHRRSITKTIAADIRKQRLFDIEICNLERVRNFVEDDALFCKVVAKSH